jgi:hypothetical protein
MSCSFSVQTAALKAAQYRRRVAGLITKFFFGRDAIAPVVAVRREGEQLEFVTSLVEGGPPKDKHRAREFLHEVTQAFIETGLPTWQVSPHNPRSVGNLMEVEDGSYRIIDLESNLVAALTPMSAVTSDPPKELLTSTTLTLSSGGLSREHGRRIARRSAARIT